LWLLTCRPPMHPERSYLGTHQADGSAARRNLQEANLWKPI
jgi:hypothetical protein